MDELVRLLQRQYDQLVRIREFWIRQYDLAADGSLEKREAVKMLDNINLRVRRVESLLNEAIPLED